MRDAGRGAEPPCPLRRRLHETDAAARSGCAREAADRDPPETGRAAPVRDAASMPARRARASPDEGPPIPRARRLALAAALALASGLRCLGHRLGAALRGG